MCFQEEKSDFPKVCILRTWHSPDPAKVEANEQCTTPKDATEVRSLLDMTNYCSRFIPNYPTLTAPLR